MLKTLLEKNKNNACYTLCRCFHDTTIKYAALLQFLAFGAYTFTGYTGHVDPCFKYFIRMILQ